MANKDTYYFKHDSNARNDIKLIKLRRKYKMEGYGAYFALIEILREQSDHKLLISDLPDLAHDLEISETKLNSIVNDFKLFKVDGIYFFSESLLNRMCEYNTLKAKRIEAGRKGRAAQITPKPNTEIPANAGQTPAIAQALDLTTLDYTRLEQTTLEESSSEPPQIPNSFQYLDTTIIRPPQAPTIEQVKSYFFLQGKNFEDGKLAERFFNHHEGLGWRKGLSPIMNWRSFALQWVQNPLEFEKKSESKDTSKSDEKYKKIMQDKNGH